MAMSPQPWRIDDDMLRVFVRLTPRGGRDGIDGVEVRSDGRPVLKARVRAAPENGEANTALVKLLAKFFGLPSSQIVLSAGHTSRIKTISARLDPDEIAAVTAVLARLSTA